MKVLLLDGYLFSWFEPRSWARSQGPRFPAVAQPISLLYKTWYLCICWGTLKHMSSSSVLHGAIFMPRNVNRNASCRSTWQYLWHQTVMTPSVCCTHQGILPFLSLCCSSPLAPTVWLLCIQYLPANLTPVHVLGRLNSCFFIKMWLKFPSFFLHYSGGGGGEASREAASGQKQSLSSSWTQRTCIGAYNKF